MRVLIVAEGPNEQHSLPTLVRRLLDTADDLELDFKKVGTRDHIHQRGPRLVKKVRRWMREAERGGYDALVFLIDEDGDPSRRKAIATANEPSPNPLPRACGVAIRTYDAWFLADERALSRTLEAQIRRQRDPETIRDPKETCLGLLANSGLDGLSELYRKVVERCDLQVLRERCPKGFAPFADRVQALATES